MGTQADVNDHDTIATELEAMRHIARALDMLPDADARNRVMRWAADRYATSPAAAPTPLEPVRPAADPSLAVDGLADLFPHAETPSPDALAPIGAAALDPPRAGMESLLRDFVADFRQFAVEWQGA